MLSEFENNGSALFMKHRDHFSHSVYMFALGMAIYETNERYRSTYTEFYGINDLRQSAHHFLRYWGMSALFHVTRSSVTTGFRYNRTHKSKSDQQQQNQRLRTNP